MNVATSNQEEINPFLQLLLLLFYAVVGAIIFTIISFVIILSIYGFAIVKDYNLIAAGDPKFIGALKILQIGTSIGMFIVPPLALAYTNRIKPSNFYGFGNPQVILLFLVLVIMIVSMPFMEWTAIWNQKMSLPSGLKWLETWMKQSEEAAMRMTIQLLTVRNNWDFVVNLIMIAVLPAIGEELMFRGGVQRSLNKAFNNPHAAIWISAIIFSAIHMQFYGFLPRLLLGAGFGYLYYFSGSIWYAMLAHFINNAYAVCMALYMQKHNMPLDKTEDPIGFPWYGYLISAILTIALFNFFKNTAQRERKLG
ncbi:CPBP family intramembrane glutamic endopeptidase [Pedobacter jejuensis]|uniref:CPBP family intramembrane metalloprotease n=1 Tax=Pedobacter jejuensis TaxID=1268550 RepID=A0A3N0BQA6_9SPHI|nr:CPBP family intramembrane glutamic endopeptidase [Pedobacter jejuensis]RNL50645.1 CPBP family intramembrane metalloprotease [Pedobacter jejuensis]